MECCNACRKVAVRVRRCSVPALHRCFHTINSLLHKQTKPRGDDKTAWHNVLCFLPLSQILTELKSDNQRLKDENGALIRVISKLSK